MIDDDSVGNIGLSADSVMGEVGRSIPLACLVARSDVVLVIVAFAFCTLTALSDSLSSMIAALDAMSFGFDVMVVFGASADKIGPQHRKLDYADLVLQWPTTSLGCNSDRCPTMCILIEFL